MKLKIRESKWKKGAYEMLCPNCDTWLAIDAREVKAIPESVICHVCHKKWGIFRIV